MWLVDISAQLDGGLNLFDVAACIVIVDSTRVEYKNLLIKNIPGIAFSVTLSQLGYHTYARFGPALEALS